jgi:hypothetical protein
VRLAAVVEESEHLVRRFGEQTDRLDIRGVSALQRRGRLKDSQSTVGHLIRREAWLESRPQRWLVQVVRLVEDRAKDHALGVNFDVSVNRPEGIHIRLLASIERGTLPEAQCRAAPRRVRRLGKLATSAKAEDGPQYDPHGAKDDQLERPACANGSAAAPARRRAPRHSWRHTSHCAFLLGTWG